MPSAQHRDGSGSGGWLSSARDGGEGEGGGAKLRAFKYYAVWGRPHCLTWLRQFLC